MMCPWSAFVGHRDYAAVAVARIVMQPPVPATQMPYRIQKMEPPNNGSITTWGFHFLDPLRVLGKPRDGRAIDPALQQRGHLRPGGRLGCRV